MSQRARWRFGDFEIDLEAGTLRRDGQPVRIGRQAFRALALLVLRGGQLVPREDLQRHLWGNGVHVDFEHGLNVCIRQIRVAVGDEASGSQIIVTCPREGYRLGVPVKRAPDAPWLRWWGLPAAVAVLAAVFLLAAFATGESTAPSGASALESPAPTVVAEGPALKLAAYSRPLAAGRPEAYALYFQGVGLYDQGGGRKQTGALRYFERAVSVDPGIAIAQAGLAVSYVDRATAGIAAEQFRTKARQAAQRALALGAQAAETHVALAEVSYRLDGDTARAAGAFERALELDDRNAYVRHRYAVFVREQGRFDEALAQLQVAQELDPLSVRSSWQAANTLFLARRYRESLAQADRTLDIDPSHPWSFRTTGQNFEALGRFDEAVQAYLKAGRVAIGHLGRLYALTGRHEEAREILDTLLRRPVDETGHNGVSIALIYTGLGEPARAIDWLRRARNDGVLLPLSLRVAPQWDNLRSSAEFKALLN